MWIVVHMAKSEVSAKDIVQTLSAEGILVRMRPVYRTASAKDNYFEIQVLASEAVEARNILLEHRLG